MLKKILETHSIPSNSFKNKTDEPPKITKTPGALKIFSNSFKNKTQGTPKTLSHYMTKETRNSFESSNSFKNEN